MKVLTIAHQKGGVGKTTLALNLAACFAQSLRVGILDTDLQGSLTSVRSDLDRITFVPFEGKVAKPAEGLFDVFIIDTPPYLTNQLPDLFALSDYVLVPSKVGYFDVMAIRSTLAVIEQVRLQKPGLLAGVVLNMVKPRTALTETIEKLLTSYGAPLLKSRITDRVSYTRSAITSGVFTGNDGRAKDEIAALADEIFTALGL